MYLTFPAEKEATLLLKKPVLFVSTELFYKFLCVVCIL